MANQSSEKSLSTTGEDFVVRTPEEKLADDALLVALKQYDTAERFQKPIFDEIQKNEDMLAGKKMPALKGRNDVPVDTIIMRGFKDTLLSNMDEPINVKFNHAREQDLKSAKKVTAVWEKEKVPSRGNYDAYVLDSKDFAATSGRGFLKLWVESLPVFAAHMDCVDHFDMLTEPMGGPYLDKHLYKGQRNIFRSESDLEMFSKEGTYNAGQVTKLKAAYTSDDFKKNNDTFKFKMQRYAAFGLNIETNDFIGSQLYNMTEWVMFYKGKWRYMVFDYRAKTWVRFQDLDKVFAHAKEYPGRGGWASYATNRHPKMFWSRAILSDVRPIAYTMKKVLNLSLDNLEKRNWDMKAYDPKVFTDPTQLMYKQDGLARATLERGRSIQSGVLQFQTPDTTSITVNLNEYLDRFISTKTGISPELQSEGQNSQQTNGIYYGNVQQSQNRISLKNKMFYQCIIDLAVIFDYGCYEHLSGKYAVKLLGPTGVEWETEVTKQDVSCDFSITITGGNDEEKANAELLTRKAATLAGIEANKDIYAPKLNINWMLREKLTAGGWSDEQIRVGMDTQNDGNDEILSEAATAIYDIIEGKVPKLNRGATTGYVQKILDYCYDTEDLDQKTFDRLLAFAKASLPAAQMNMIRKAQSVLASMGQDPTQINAKEGYDKGTKLPVNGGTISPAEIKPPTTEIAPAY
jgi:hypothetical protein